MNAFFNIVIHTRLPNETQSLHPGCPACSSTNMASRTVGGITTLFPHMTHPSRVVNSVLRTSYSLRSSPKVAGQPSCVNWYTRDNTGSRFVQLAMSLPKMGNHPCFPSSKPLPEDPWPLLGLVHFGPHYIGDWSRLAKPGACLRVHMNRCLIALQFPQLLVEHSCILPNRSLFLTVLISAQFSLMCCSQLCPNKLAPLPSTTTINNSAC